MENGFVRQEGQEIVKYTKPKEDGTVWDYIMSIACETEAAAFEQGFRRGILFMMDMMRGGVGCNA